MEAVYQLTGLEKEIIEVNPAQYDMRYFMERAKKFSGVEQIDSTVIPKINPLKLKKIKGKLLGRINGIPSYYIMYPGRDKSVATKKSVLHPQYPKDK